MGHHLADVLNQYIGRRSWSFERLAEVSGLPRNTVYRWTRGEVKRVRHWQDLAKTARALDLNRSQTNVLLQAGGHPAIEVLLERATDPDDRDLLARWSRSAPSNLPAHLTSFVGRRQELVRLTELLASARLVTLTGPGGSGKTRLAIEAARAVLDEFEEVAFVDLAPVWDPDLVLPTIARALDLKASPEEPPLLALTTALRDRCVLLVLDNVEHVVAAAPLVTELLRSTNRVKALVTSRTRLNVRGEHELAVPPLPLPRPTSGFAELTHNPSVALFADRARAVNTAFALTPESGPLVAEVCARLDGLPLGIELAAARTGQMRLGSMLARFPGRLALASAGPRDAPDRQRTLRAAIAWSHDLLEDDERALFACLGVFVGGFTEEAAASVGAGSGCLHIDVPAGLASLVEQSLLRRVWADEDQPRYEMLETIREYALERLEARGQAEAAFNAAAGYYVGLAERADLQGGAQALWLARLGAEHDTFRAVLGWCRERGDFETGLRLCVALMPLWQLRDHQLEARTWLETFMAAPAAVSPGVRARGLLWQGLLLMRQTGNNGAASPLFAEALALFRDVGNLDGASEALQAEGDVYRERRDYERARRRYAESLELAERAGNAYLVAHGHLGLALCAQEAGRFDDAQQHWQLTLEWAERAGNDASVALALNSLGEMARHRGEWDDAERYYQRALRLARELGSEFRIALALHNLGYVALHGEQPERASTLFADSLSLYEGRQYHKGVAECLAGLARVAISRGELERAARLCGAVEAILGSLGTQLDTLDRAAYERTRACLRSHLGDRLDALVAEGRSMTTERAVAYATASRNAGE